jgi:acetyl-CoA carboxylase biotin carboxyl carrier protein
VNGQSQPTEGSAHETFVDLAEMHKHAVELLAQLDRPPRSLHIQAGALALDITWADAGARSDPSAPTAPTAVATVPAAGADRADGAARDYLRSPGVGVFYHAREPGAEPFVSVGSQIRQGQQIGIIEAMKLMIPVEADRAGRVSDVLKADGESVEYDEPLFALDAADA